MASSEDGRIYVRPFEARDTEKVREMVVGGYMNGEHSPFRIAMRSVVWEPICAVSYPLSGLGLGLLLKYRHAGLSNGGFAAGLLLALAFPVIWVKFWQRKSAQLWWDYCERIATVGDLADIGVSYADKGEHTVGGFWVAVAGEGGEERIAGCAGLESGGPGSSYSELQRVSVSEDYRRRGVATLLINTAIAHARAGGLRKIKLYSTTYQANAQVLYRRLGFVEVGKVRLAPVWVRGGWNHEMDLELR